MSVVKQVTRTTIILHLENEKKVRSSKTSYLLQTTKVNGGGNGFVMFAKNEKTGQKVALKFYFPNNPEWQLDEDNYKRFQNEISLLKKGEHPNLIKCFDSGKIKVDKEKVPFYVMPIANGSMRDIINKNQFARSSLVII